MLNIVIHMQGKHTVKSLMREGKEVNVELTSRFGQRRQFILPNYSTQSNVMKCGLMYLIYT